MSALKNKVSNRGVPPDSFLSELVSWAKGAPDEIFMANDAYDIYASVHFQLGPYMSLQHRKAVMLECLRVLGGFESSWNWQEGVDTTNKTSMAHAEGQETGLWQVSQNSVNFGDDLVELVDRHCGGMHTPEVFIPAMKKNHPLAVEYIARLLRHTVNHNGPVKRKEINAWLSLDAVREFEKLLASKS